MELSAQSYIDIMQMPIIRFYNYLKWKIKIEEEKQKLIAESNS